MAMGQALPALPGGALPGGALPKTPQPLAPLPSAPPGAFPVPPTTERPLAANQGERVFVKKFVVTGVKDHPSLGINKVQLQQLVDKLRIKREGLDKVGKDGFTADERAQIASFMKKVVANPDQDMLFQDYQALVDKLRAERAKRMAGMTIGQMQEIADAVTKYYRSAGLMLAQAYVPAQEVKNGQVTIHVVEGKLGNVIVQGNKDYSSKVLAGPFKSLIDAPVQASSVESRILTLNDFPGLSAFGVFQPGKEVGTSDLVLRVQKEKRLEGSLTFDNHGTQYTGRYRTLANFSWNNPTGVGDVASVELLKQYKPANSIYGRVAYERPVMVPGLSIGADFSHNPYTVGGPLQNLHLTGSSTIGDVYIKHTLLRSRARNVYAKVGLTRQKGVTELSGAKISKDNISAVEARINFDSIDAASRAINQGSLTFTSGLGTKLGGMSGNDTPAPSRTSISGKHANNNFFKVDMNYARLQTLAPDLNLLLRLEGQYSHSLLTSLQQFSLGGPDSVRAYPVSEYYADTGILASMDWTLNLPDLMGFGDKPAFAGHSWGDILRVSFFSDWGWGELNRPSTNDVAKASLFGVGMGAQVTLPGQFTGRLQVARPIGAGVVSATNPNGSASDARVWRWWMDLTYNF